MLRACLQCLIGCLHQHQTRPFTLNRTCYTVCLDCGRELPYSWVEMRPLRRAECAESRHPAGEEASVTA